MGVFDLLQKRLVGRANGQFHDSWHGYVYKKNHTRFEQPKLLVPSIATGSCFAVELEGYYHFVGSGGGGGGGYGITVKPRSRLSLIYLLGVLNSSLHSYYLRQISTPFRGGYYALNRQYIEQLPIPTADEGQQAIICRVAEYLLWLHRQREGSLSDKSQALPIPGYFEQLLNGLVYELFFADELHAQKLFLFKYVEEAKLPVLSEIPEVERLTVLREAFERIYDLNHPIRGCLFSLGALETVRIIEGEG